MRNIIATVCAALTVPVCAHARVVWSDDYTDQTASIHTNPARRFVASSGNDYIIQEYTASSPAQMYVSFSGFDNGNRSNTLTFADDSSSRLTSVTVPMTRFAAFDTSTPADRLLHIQFDMGIAGFTGDDSLRFIIKPDSASTSNLILGFGAANIFSGSPKEVFFYAANGGTTDSIAPLKEHAIGLTSDGNGFKSDFDFGTYSSVQAENRSFAPASLVPPYDMYRFMVTFDGTTYNGTVMRTNVMGGFGDDVATFSVTVPSATLSNIDSLDQFIITTNTTSKTYAHIDNIQFSVTPEPSAALLMFGAAGLFLRRRRGLN